MDTIRPPKGLVGYDVFTELDLRVARVVECREHPNADKLLILTIDLGGERRQICAPLKGHYAPEALLGKLVVVIANLAPRTMRGEASQGMLLSVTDPGTGKVIIITPATDAAPGSIVS